MGANFSPEFLNYNNKGSFVFWAQKVIPLVYDNSLSYYETLCKVVSYLNNVIENVETTEENLNSLKEAYDLLQGYVNDYFENLDVQEEINNKLDELVAQGYFANFFTNFVTPEQYGAVGDGVTDDTLAISAAINTHKPVVFGNDKTYIVTELPAYWGMKLYGNGCTLKRPNLTASPYNWSDEDIKWNRFFDMRTIKIGNVVDEVTIFDGITFDGNAFSMWSESDGYKYEQASFVAFAAARGGARAQTIFTNCKFIDNFASGVSVAENIDIQMSDCYARNCFKGIITVVGQNCIVNMNNIVDKNDYDSFATINVEINHPSDTSTELPTFINVTNAYLEKNFKTGNSYGTSVMNYTNVEMRDMKSIIFLTAGTTNFSNCQFELTYNGTSSDFRYPIYGAGYFRFDKCDFRGVGATQTIGFTTNATAISARFVDCMMRNLPQGFYANSIYTANSLHFIRVTFSAINGDLIAGWGREGFNFREIIFDSCYLDCTGYIYKMIASSSSISGTPVYFRGQNIIGNANCLGLYVYGRDSNTWNVSDMFVFDNQEFVTNTNGMSIRVDRSGNHPPILRGRRERIVTQDPNNIENGAPAYYPIDYAVLKYSPHTVWRYNGTEWVTVTE